MAKRTDLRTILIIGSGPIVIGQGAEFDYSGTQALKALREAGYRSVVVNSNSATIMTDPQFSDAVYIEPLTAEFLEAIIAHERPDALLPTLGGQTALNLAVELAERGILDRYDVELIGAPLAAIRRAEDRQGFKDTMLEIGLAVPRSQQIESIPQAMAVADELGYPLIARPSFTLGGTGGGIAYNAEELTHLVARGLTESPTNNVLLEESVIGWKELEIEAMRDCDDNAVVVCSIENLDPMGVHTGDSITVAPIQTLTDREYQLVRDAALRVLRAIGVEAGGANIQFAIHPRTGRMVVIEMNPRVSRSSALASKATGYAIAKVAALLAVGYRLDEIPNDITGRTTAAFEPTLDYVVVKVPRFQLEKFPGADPRLTTQMKSVGEVLAMGRTFNEALGKALRSLELDATPKLDFDHVREYLATPTPERLAYVFAALRLGFSAEEIHEITHIDGWFLSRLEQFVRFEEVLRATGWEEVGPDMLHRAKVLGFSDRELGEIFDVSEREARLRRRQKGVQPVFKMVDTCAAEFEATTPYFYSTYGGTVNEARRSPDDGARLMDEEEGEAVEAEGRETGQESSAGANRSRRSSVIILGSGPNRIGQGIEFDYANVHAVWALQEEGYETIMVNSNPETVSTDYDTADRLFFEPLTMEDVLPIVANENPVGVVVGFGGQTPLKLARTLVREGVGLLGSGFPTIDLAEDREQFGGLLDRLGLNSPAYGMASDADEALRVADGLGYPVLVRPSYILGGRAVVIADTPEDLRHYVDEAARVSPGHPILIDRFLDHSVEMDVDVLTDGRDVWLAGLMEQIEEAGVHSGDSACVLPPVSVSGARVRQIEKAVAGLVREMGCVGLVNIQLALKGHELFILEANPRASRTVPFVSKAIGIPVAKLAAKILAGRPLRALLAPYWPYRSRHSSGQESGDVVAPCCTLDEILDATGVAPTPWPQVSSVKEVVLPFGRFPGSDVLLGPEMRSTGEVMSFGESFPEAFAKAQVAAGNPLPGSGTVLVSLADPDKREGTALVSQLHDWGFDIVATQGTRRALEAMAIPAGPVLKVGEGRPDVVDRIAQGGVSLVVNTPSSGQAASAPEQGQPRRVPLLPTGAEARGVPLNLQGKRTVGYRIRTAALEHHIPYVTTLVALRAAVAAIRSNREGELNIYRLHEGREPERVAI